VYNRHVHDLRINLFGSPEIRRGSQEVLIQRRKDLALLIYLVVTAQPHRRDTLATLLWEDQNQAEARSNLRKSLSRLKSILGEDALLTSQDQVRLNPNFPIDADLAQFNTRIQQFHQHGHALRESAHTICRDCQRALEEAAQVYRADFLSGFSVSDSSVFEEWQFFQAESLRKELAEILEQLAHLYTNKQQYKTAIEYGRRWLALDRLNESAHRQLMTLYALSGERAAAKRQFEECRRILKEELGAEPEEETLQLFNELQKKRKIVGSHINVSSATATQKHNLPVHPAPFIGREKELGEIIRFIKESPYRLLTLLGPGGSGKTRLALQVGTTLEQDSDAPVRDEIWFVPLAPLTRPESILDGIAQSLGMTARMSGSDARDSFYSEIRGRELLLLLDNFEHLLNADSTGLITEILSASPRTRIVITSRERLDVEGEYVFPVGGLEIPTNEALVASGQENTPVTTFSALQLFEQAAIRVQPGFRINEQNYQAVVDICTTVQGMPLAIELAASWIEIYSPREILQEIVRSLDFLQSNWRDLPDRQRSLRAVFDSSWSLLDKTTRPVIKALSVFRSSFTREAAQAISCASAKTLLDLTHKSWIQRLSDGRYQIHELLRQFAFEKLSSETVNFELVKKQFCDYYADYSSSLWIAMKGADQRKAFSGVEAEFENLQIAWTWLISMGQLDTGIQKMVAVLVHYSELRGKTVELGMMLELALKTIVSSGRNSHDRKNEIIVRTAKGLFTNDSFPLRYGMQDAIFPQDTASVERAWKLARKKGKLYEFGLWGILLCYVYGRVFKREEGIGQLEQMLPVFERENQSWELATAYLHLLKLMIPNGPHSAKQQKTMTYYLTKARTVFTRLGDAINTGHILSLWGELEFQLQDVEGASQQWQLARSKYLEVDEWGTASNVLWQLSNAYMQLGDFPQAFRGFEDIANTHIKHGLRHLAVNALSKESFEMVRYGSIDEALQIRQRCLDIIYDTGPAYQLAWNSWEMGEIMRVMGKLEQASEWYTKSYRIFDEEQDNVGRSYYFRGIADIALERRDFMSARENFSTCVQLARTVNHLWMIAYSLTGLTRAELGLHIIPAAKKHILDALRFAARTLDKGIALVALAGYAEVCQQLEKHDKAVELASVVNEHFASWHETRKHAAALLDSVRKQMPADKYLQHRNKGCTLDLWTCVTSSINELGTKATTPRVNKNRTRKRRISAS
jgi:predicted ATPase/DNA-binding SARP family transcriptional activator